MNTTPAIAVLSPISILEWIVIIVFALLLLRAVAEALSYQRLRRVLSTLVMNEGSGKRILSPFITLLSHKEVRVALGQDLLYQVFSLLDDGYREKDEVYARLKLVFEVYPNHKVFPELIKRAIPLMQTPSDSLFVHQTLMTLTENEPMSSPLFNDWLKRGEEVRQEAERVLEAIIND